jgi:hypothetical protein
MAPDAMRQRARRYLDSPSRVGSLNGEDLAEILGEPADHTDEADETPSTRSVVAAIMVISHRWRAVLRAAK